MTLLSQKVGSHGCTVWFGERKLGGNIALRWTCPLTGKVKWEAQDFSIRDDRGQIRRGEVNKAHELAKSYSAQLQDGIIPGRQRPATNRALTLKDGYAQALDLVSGMRGVTLRTWKQWCIDRDYVLQILGEDFTWNDLLPTTCEKVWRHMLRDSTAGELRRAAEKAISTLYQVSNWLYERNPKEIERVGPRRKWKAALHREWELRFGPPPEAQTELRHSEEETQLIFARLDEADPRVQLVLEIGAELRTGQVLRSQRNAVLLDDKGAFGLGTITVRGEGNKKGEVIHIHPELKKALLRCFSGHLQELEAAYQSGKIPNYYLFQSGRMRKRERDSIEVVNPLERALKHPGSQDITTLIPLFHKFERAIGIEPLMGRGFYGLRRVLTDIAADYTTDGRALDRLTGHTDSGTRERRYQNRQREKDRGSAAEVRRKMRADLKRRGTDLGCEPPGNGGRNPTAPEDLESVLRELQAGMIDSERAATLIRQIGGTAPQ